MNIKETIGDLESIDRIVRLIGYINCAPDFIQLSQVMDGASDLLVEIFGDSGRHTRTVLGGEQSTLEPAPIN